MKQHNKLIRDKIPEIMTAKGVEYRTHILSDSEFKLALLHKLVEEATEALEASNDTHSLAMELARCARSCGCNYYLPKPKKD